MTMPSIEKQLEALAAETLDQTRQGPRPSSAADAGGLESYATPASRGGHRGRWIAAAAALLVLVGLVGVAVARTRDPGGVSTSGPSTTLAGVGDDLASLRQRAEAVAGLPATRVTVVNTTAGEARNLIGESSTCPAGSEIVLYQFEFDRAFIDVTYRGPYGSFPPIGRAVLLPAPAPDDTSNGCGGFMGVLPSPETLALYGEPAVIELEQAPAPDLTGGDWRLVQVEAPGLDPVDWPVGQPMLRFLAEGSVQFFNGCNDMSGGYTLTNFTVDFGDSWTSTLRGCSASAASDALGDVIASDPIWVITPDGLLVLASSQNADQLPRLTFERSN